MVISFVIPALNEEAYIGATIRSITDSCREILEYEIVLVDHGSSDRTPSIAGALGAKVIAPKVETIGALRNRGVYEAVGEILVFVDADVTLASEWRKHVLGVLDSLRKNPFQVAGSKCNPPDDGTLLSGFWYTKLSQEANPTHIGTPHMIVHRELFRRIGGFDEGLKTGEDYDFCERAKAAGAVLAPDARLGAIHNRLPRTLREFVLRERWHGLSDFRSLSSLLSSKVALMTLAFLFIHLVLLGGAVLLNPYVLTGSILVLSGHLYLSARKKFGRLGLLEAAKAMFVFYFYYTGRALALLPQRRRRWMQAA